VSKFIPELYDTVSWFQANEQITKRLLGVFQAMKSSWFRSSRFKKGKQKGNNAGLGFQERPGLGSGSGSTSSSSSSYEQNDYLMSTTSDKVNIALPYLKKNAFHSNLSWSVPIEREIAKNVGFPFCLC
jgi:hypothetical protein